MVLRRPQWVMNVLTGVTAVLILFLWQHVFFTQFALAQSVEELQEELRQKRENLKNVEERIKRFKEELQIKKKEARTLEEQLTILEKNTQSLELTVDRTKAEIEETNAEIAAVLQEITRKEEEISHNKTILAEYLKSLYLIDQQSAVTIFLKYSTFAEAVTETAALTELQGRSRDTLIAIKQLRDDLKNKQEQLEDFKQTLEKLKRQQEQQLRTLETQQRSKETILKLTRAQEAEFTSLLADAQRAHKESDAEIRRLDTLVREELNKQGIGKLPSVGVFDWPLEAIFGVSCEFHCPDYPYTYLIGPHSGVDIPTYVGTPIQAPADGYIARTHDAGGPGYNYILLLHGDNISTVYGHVSGFAAGEGTMVTRGTVIGYTGGAPGTRGAGLSSGPHLHFEVRHNNSPVNPRSYLP